MMKFGKKWSVVGCPCDDHGFFWIQCTEKNCRTWFCTKGIRQILKLNKMQIKFLEKCPKTFKCIEHGFYQMRIPQTKSKSVCLNLIIFTVYISLHSI